MLFRLCLPRDRVLYHLGGNIPDRIHIFLVGGSCLLFQFFQLAVKSSQLCGGLRILSGDDGASLFGIPAFRCHLLPGGILAHFSVKGDTAHDGTSSVLLDFPPVDVEQQLERASHPLASFIGLVWSRTLFFFVFFYGSCHSG